MKSFAVVAFLISSYRAVGISQEASQLIDKTEPTDLRIAEYSQAQSKKTFYQLLESEKSLVRECHPYHTVVESETVICSRLEGQEGQAWFHCQNLPTSMLHGTMICGVGTGIWGISN